MNDRPDAVRLHRFTNFETAIVLRGAHDDQPDTVLAAFRWGYTCAAPGADPAFSIVRPGGAPVDYPDEDTQVTQRFREIVAHDYPAYTFVEP